MFRSAALAALVLFTHVAGAATAVPAPPDTWISLLQRDHPLVGRIWSRRTRSFIDPAMLAARLKGARYVLAGETHDNRDHHRLQAWLISSLTGQGRKPAIVFEMIPRDLSATLAAYRAAHPDDAAGLGRALDWEKRGWPAWSMYRPIAEAAFAAHLPLLGGDLSRDTLKRFRRNGIHALGTGETFRLGLDRAFSLAATKTLKQALRDGHCGLLPEPAVDAMVPIQRARDASLADVMIESAQSTDGALLIAGAGHARGDIAVPWYLRKRQPGATIVSIALTEVQRRKPDPRAYLPTPAAYDYLWFTPVTARKDPCKALRERFGKKNN